MAVVLEHSTREGTGDGPALATRTQLRLLVVDDHPAVRRGLVGLLGDEPDFDVVAAVASAEEALPLARRTRPDVAVVDYQLAGHSGLWLSRKLKRLPDPPRVVVYSAHSEGTLTAAAVVAEADGLVSKSALGSDLADAIRAVADGRLLLPFVPWRLAEVIRRRLDEREQAIYGMVLAGIPIAEVAQTLDAPEAAIDTRLWEMLRKLEPIDAERALVT